MASLKLPFASLWVSPFRPFGLLGMAYGVALMALWLAARVGAAGPPHGILAPALWHGHEMLFGFAVAIICATVLTALPSWAGTPEIRGAPLAGLLALWLAGRVAFWAAGSLPPWLVIAASGRVDGMLATICIVAGLGLFGLGETLWAPVLPALVNELAREELRGRYNALQSMVWTVSSIIGPALAGLLLGTGLAGVWVACVVGGTTVSALLFLRLRRHLSVGEDGRAVPVSALP